MDIAIMDTQTGIHLKSIELVRVPKPPQRFPFTVPVIRALERLEFGTQVTFLVGENGSGKSTLLEGIACAVGSITVGSESVDRDRSLDDVRPLGKQLKLTWSVRTRRGFFMRAEDYFNYATKMARMREELQRDLDEVDEAYRDRSRTAQMYARAAYQSQIGALEQYYGEGLDVRSHGESFLDFFQARFVPGGLYLLDEPEAPLSPLRQLSFLILLKEMIAHDAQFIIATHSPIIMAFPGATILDFDGERIEEALYDELEHVRIMRGFLDHPARYLAQLLD